MTEKAWIEVGRNNTHKLLLSRDGLHCCLDHRRFPEGPIGLSQGIWEQAGTWDLGIGGGYRREGYVSSDYVPAPEPSATAGKGKLTVGCIVRIDSISRESLIPDYMLGWTGVVTDMDPGLDVPDRIEIRTDNDTTMWFICPRDLTVLAERPKPAEQARHDPYSEHRLYEETLSVAVVDHYAGNQAARLRNIAALKAEQSKPFAPRFPPEGRTERALPRSNRDRR